MRGSSFLCALFVLLSSIHVSAQAQSFADRLQDATIDTLGALHEEFSVPRGDVDLSGETNFADFLTITNAWGETREDLTYQEGDINLDGQIDLADFAMHTFNFGETNFRPDPPSRPPVGNLGLWRDENGMLTVSTATPVAVGAFEISSQSGGLLRPIRTPPPFVFFLDFAPSNVLIASLASAPILDGDLATTISSTTEDLEIRWIEAGSYDVYSLPFAAGDELTGRPTLENPAFTGPTEPNPIPISLSDFDAATDLESLLALHQEQDIPRGELDRIQEVTESDIDVLASNWGNTEPTYSEGDLNLDGEVGLGDLAILAPNFGRSEWFADTERAIDQPADLTLTTDGFGRLQLTSDRPVDLGGFELSAVEEGEDILRVIGDQDLFEQNILTEGDLVVFGNLRSATTIDRETTLDGVRLSQGTDQEVTLRWFETGSSLVFESGPFSLTSEFDITAGDIDGDGVVSFADFLDLSETYGQAVEPSTGADITGDGRVNFNDFLILSHNFGIEPAAQAAAEPTFGFRFGLLLVSLLLCSFRSRRGG